MNLIVHIGAEKTGTTAIQEMLFANREVLESNGYKLLECAGKKNQRKFPSFCLADDKCDDYFRDREIISLEQKIIFREKFLEDFHDELSRINAEVHTVIISSEHLSSRLNTQAEVLKFYDLVAPYFANIRVICYLREQVETAVSRYSTGLKSGVANEFKRALNNCHPGNIYYNYYEMLRIWSSVFGQSGIKVKIYSKKNFVDGDLISDFLHTVSPELVGIVDKKIGRHNVSISSFGQGIALSINRLYSVKEHAGRKANKIVRSRLVNGVSVCFPGRGKVPSFEQYQEIYTSFYESNSILNQEYLNSDCELFEFSPPRRRSILPELEGFSLIGYIKFSMFYIFAFPSLFVGARQFVKFLLFHHAGIELSKPYFKKPLQ
jgi:hypothetical protein